MGNKLVVKHPFTGKAELVRVHQGALYLFTRRREAKYKHSNAMYHIDEIFAVIRPAKDGNGVADARQGFVVARDSFDEIRYFDTLEQATIYVESLFALEGD